jgi:hypothetical protein
MGLVAFAGKLAPGKTAEWRQFVDELHGPRKAEYEASRKRLRIKKERAFVQPGPDGDTVIYTFTRYGAPAVALPPLFRDLSASRDPFDVWYKQRMKDLLGLDFEAKGETPPAEMLFRMGPRRVRPPEPAPSQPA